MKKGEEIWFVGEKKPFKIMAANEKFVVCARKMCRRADANLMHFEVERGAYMTFTEAYNAHKNDPVYTIVDFDKKIRGPHNIIFNHCDFNSEEECEELLEELMNGETQVSKRHFVELDYYKKQ